MTAAKPPFTATLTQNQSIAGKKSQCGLASGSGWPKRGKPSIALRILFNPSHTVRMAAKCPAKAIAVWSGAVIKIAVVPDFVHLLLKSSKCFIQATGAQFFAWRMSRGQNVELVGDCGQQRFRFPPHVIEEPWLYSMPA